MVSFLLVLCQVQVICQIEPRAVQSDLDTVNVIGQWSRTDSVKFLNRALKRILKQLDREFSSVLHIDGDEISGFNLMPKSLPRAFRKTYWDFCTTKASTWLYESMLNELYKSLKKDAWTKGVTGMGTDTVFFTEDNKSLMVSLKDYAVIKVELVSTKPLMNTIELKSGEHLKFLKIDFFWDKNGKMIGNQVFDLTVEKQLYHFAVKHDFSSSI